jgi:hypothetical protein
VQVSEDEGKSWDSASLKNSVLYFKSKKINIEKHQVVILKQNTILVDGELWLKFKSVNDL